MWLNEFSSFRFSLKCYFPVGVGWSQRVGKGASLWRSDYNWIKRVHFSFGYPFFMRVSFDSFVTNIQLLLEMQFRIPMLIHFVRTTDVRWSSLDPP